MLLDMLLFKNKSFKDYIEFFNFLVYNELEIKGKWFPHNDFFYARVALEEKFKRKFSLKETMELINKELALKTITLKAPKPNASC